MAVGPYCRRCETHVRLEQNGHTCSNCGRNIVTTRAYETPPETPPPKPPKENS